MLPDGVLGVDFGDVGVVLLDGLFELVLLGRLVFACFGGLSVQLLGGELDGWVEDAVSGLADFS